LKNANPLSSAARAILVLATLGLVGCGDQSPSAADPAAVPIYTYEIVHVWPHDPKAFTEGLSWLNGGLLESTGLEGASDLRKVDLATGLVRQRAKLPPRYFGEGSVVIGDKIYQVTWKTEKGFVYDLGTLEEVKEFSYAGEGWGLTTDGRSIIMSNGSNQIQFIDPATFQVTRTISVFSNGQPLRNLNELEYVKGELYANIWQFPTVARIDPATGRLLGLIDFSGLLEREGGGDPPPDVLNGIAYDAADDRLFVTGKNWPNLFEVRVKRK
jgi:glutaminyl-peptide cyclotransferase